MVLLPGAVLTLLGGGCVAWLLAADPSGSRRALVLGAAVVVALAVLAAGAAAARSAQRRLAGSTAELDRAAADIAASVSFGDAQLRRALEELRQGRTPDKPAAPSELRDATGRFKPLLEQLEYSRLTAFTALTEAADLPAPNGAASQQVTVLVNLARRLQSLVHQGIRILDELEQQVEDPDLLRGLFEVDHIATRIRRYVENVAVLGGEVTRRQWRKPVPLASVVRSAIGEVERYSRVKPVPPIDGRLDGAAVADVVHLLAELIENATAFSPPGTQVYVRTQQVTTGMVIEIEDRGLGQQPDDERLRNTLLANPERVELGALLKDGRVGLYVVAVLARQHQIRVELRRNLFGGVTSLVLLPNPLLSSENDDAGDRGASPAEDAHGRAAEPAVDRGDASGYALAAAPVHLPQDAPAPAGRTARQGGGRHTQAPAAPLPVQPPAPAPAQAAAPQPYPQDLAAAPAPQEYAMPRDYAAQQLRAPAPPLQQPPVQQHPVQPQLQPLPQSQSQFPSLPQDRMPSQPAPQGYGLPQARGGGEDAAAFGRPPLPQRTQQTHMAPQLQRSQESSLGGSAGYRQPDETEFTPANPGLMATYRQGVRAAEEQSGSADG
ncbi:ATP-binding protein [Streptomyces sp. V4-01]|uniref:histidine kinase n=1 Tax=Actinacidiphila polyblastidii TaxID=3110430 RepID=A0ABU7P7Y7_9ACTN|nr:ATP-binding protein [Streptomyces sp. V4-01]